MATPPSPEYQTPRSVASTVTLGRVAESRSPAVKSNRREPAASDDSTSGQPPKKAKSSAIHRPAPIPGAKTTLVSQRGTQNSQSTSTVPATTDSLSRKPAHRGRPQHISPHVETASRSTRYNTPQTPRAPVAVMTRPSKPAKPTAAADVKPPARAISPEAEISPASGLFMTPIPPPTPIAAPSIQRATTQATAVKSPAETRARGKPSKPAGLGGITGSGRGLAANSLPRRHRRVLRDSVMGITKPDIRRLARRGGVSRISADIYSETRVTIKEYLTRVLKDVHQLLTSVDPNRKIVRVEDVLWALKRQGRTIYGFDDVLPKRARRR